MPVNFTIKTQNLSESIAKLKLLPGAQRAELMIQIDKTNLLILRDSKTKPPRVPVDTGALQSTGRVERAEAKNNVIEGSVIYGGVASNGVLVDYAVYVHDPGRPVKFKRPGAGPGFVRVHAEARFTEMKQDLEEALGKGARRLFH